MSVLRRMLTATTVAASFLASVVGQQLVRDLAQTGPAASSDPRSFVATPTFCAFLAQTEDAGREPWVTDGTAAGTFRLADLLPGSESSQAVLYCAYQGRVLIGGAGRLFLSDGTVAGTTVVPDLGINPASFQVLGNGRLLANTWNGVYATDLSVAGTQPIPGMPPFVEKLAVGGVSYGHGRSGDGPPQLWATDGTVAGSHRIATLPPGFAPAAFVAWNGRIYFVEGAPSLAPSMWISSTDGIAGFTRHAALSPLPLSPQIHRMLVHNNRLVFAMSGALMVSDLTQAGTVALAVPCNDVSFLVEQGGAIYFRATTAAAGYELWTTDGTVAGTTQVADLLPGSAGSHPEHMLETAAGLLFRARLPQGRRLLRLNAPSTLVDLGPIPDNAPSGGSVLGPLSGFAPFQGGVLFGGTDAAGTELWRYDGAQPPARLVDIASSGPSLQLAAGTVPAAVRDRLFFRASDGVTGSELWSTDGTASGTQVLDLVPGSGSVLADDHAIARFGDHAVFASNQGVRLTAGTPASTSTLLAAGAPGPCKVAGDAIYFVGPGGLHRSDGTAAGTALLPFSQLFSLQDFEVLGDRIVLQTGTSCYGTDGVAFPEPLGVVGISQSMHRIEDDRLVITSTNGIWVTDGTAAGTSRLAVLGGTYLVPPATGPGVAYRAAVSNTSGPAVFRTDGTAAGTYYVPMTYVPMPIDIETLIPTANELFAVASTPATGRELWRLDAVARQFVLVADFAPGILSGVQSASWLGSGNVVFVAAGDASTGIELYLTDGTPAGTALVADLHPGNGSSNPKLLGVADDTVFFLATDGVHGRELWSMPLAVATAASVQNIGLGCAGSAGRPRLATTAVPHPGAQGFGLRLEGTRPFAPTAFGLANDHATLSLGGCELLLGGAIATRLGFANLAGRTTFSLPLPASPLLLGARFVGQGFAIDPLVPAGFTSSDGAIFVAGR